MTNSNASSSITNSANLHQLTNALASVNNFKNEFKNDKEEEKPTDLTISNYVPKKTIECYPWVSNKKY